MTGSRFPCPCCGHHTFAQPPPNSWEICPVCFWEDAPEDSDAKSSNGVSLLEGQRNFLRVGACAVRWQSEVRPPRPEETKDPNFRTIDEERSRLTVELARCVEHAFADVQLGGGVTLHQSHVLDEHGGAAELARAAELDPEERWQHIPKEKLLRLDGAFPFLDARGYRFYLPAYLRSYAQELCENDGVISGSALWWFSLDGGEFYRDRHYTQLNEPQRTCIATFLAAIARVGAPSEASDATRFLRTYWGQWLPPPPSH